MLGDFLFHFMLFFMNLHLKIMSGSSNREIKHQVLIVRLQDWCWTFSATVFPAPADLRGRGKLSALLLLFKGLALSFYILWKKKLFILPSTGFVCWLVLFWWKQLFHVLYWGRTVYFLCGCVRCGRPLSAICELRIKFYYKLLFCFFVLLLVFLFPKKVVMYQNDCFHLVGLFGCETNSQQAEQKMDWLSVKIGKPTGPSVLRVLGGGGGK